MRGGAGAGRGGLARGGAAHVANGFGGRPFIPGAASHVGQNQPPVVPVVEPGMIPIPIQVDAYGYAVVDAHGYPIPAGGGQAPVVQAQIPPGCIDPRQLDPTRYWLLGQLEWWFSVDNLCRDLFLRSKVSFELLFHSRSLVQETDVSSTRSFRWMPTDGFSSRFSLRSTVSRTSPRIYRSLSSAYE